MTQGNGSVYKTWLFIRTVESRHPASYLLFKSWDYREFMLRVSINIDFLYLVILLADLSRLVGSIRELILMFINIKFQQENSDPCFSDREITHCLSDDLRYSGILNCFWFLLPIWSWIRLRISQSGLNTDFWLNPV